ncbi:Calcium-independent phospholipase A2-gamma, partial [Stegodyphus mimosarum]
MKAHGVLSQAISWRSFPIFRAVSSSKRKKRFWFSSHYGTSSKPASSNLNSSKNNFLNLIRNTTDNLRPMIWKSVTVASSLFNNVTLRFSKNKIVEEPKSVSVSTNIQKLSEKTSTSGGKMTVIPGGQSDKREASLEQGFAEWLTGDELQTKKKEFFGKEEKYVEKSKKVVISKSSLQQRSRFLVSSLIDATSSGSQLLRLEEICKHLLLYPDQKSTMCKAGLVRTALHMKCNSSDNAVRAQARCTLSLVGYNESPKGHGIRILSIDGGGTRGIIAIEVLRQLEARTNKRIYELFDFMCGVSSGAVLSLLLGGLRLSLDECEALYRRLSDEVFSQSSFWGTSRLMWSHAYYDTTMWVKVLKKTFGEKLLIDTCKEEFAPKLAAVSALMNLPHLQAFVFRNYDFPPHVQSYYHGSCRYRMWEAIRASGAAPGYFEEYCLDDYLHQDGGIMVNNPTALAIHEAQLLWPSDGIQCVMSLGSGRYIPPVQPNFTSTSLKTKVLKVIDSATD